jgi:hypothetical protein
MHPYCREKFQSILPAFNALGILRMIALPSSMADLPTKEVLCHATDNPAQPLPARFHTG